MLKAIVCVDNKWAIGKNNDLLFNLKEDMRFFRLKTREQIVFCGRKTLQSFPGGKPLANRSTICLCSENYERDDCFCIHDFDQAVKLVTELSKTKDVYVIGGAMLYEAMMPYYDKIYVTRVDADGNGTVFFPSLEDQTEFILTNESFEVEENGYKYKFCTYERRFKNER